MLHFIAHNRALIFEMTKRDIKDRYIGQVFGGVWFTFHSLFTVAVYIFLFSFVYKGSLASPNFPLFLLSGLLPWMFLIDTLGRGVSVIYSNSALVKQVVFPLEVLPIKIVLSSSITFIMSATAIIGFSFHSNGLSHMLFLIPFLFFLLVIFAMGLVFAVASVGAYVRDLKDVVQVFSTIGLYLLPIVYSEKWVPSMLKPFIDLNPLTYLVYCFQDALYYGDFAHPVAWIVFPTMAFLVFISGCLLFQKLKISFGSFL